MMVDYAFEHDGVLIILSCSMLEQLSNPYLPVCGGWIALASPAAKERLVLVCSFAASSVLYNSLPITSTKTARIPCLQLL